MPKIKDFLTSYLSILISIVTNFILLPFYLSYFGTADYGAWIVINTFVQYLALANFGIPTSLTVIAANLKNKSLINGLYNKSLKILFFIILIVTLFIYFLIFKNVINSEFFFGKSSKTDFYFESLSVCFLLYSLRAPMQLSLSIFSALGEVHLSKIYEILTNICWPFSFLIVYYLNFNLKSYILISGILMFIISILSFVHSKMLVHKIDKVDIIDNLPSNISILSSSFGYFLISIGAALVWNTDNILIAKFLPLQQVTIYSLTFRIYTVGFLVFSTINSVLMPYYGIFKSQGSFDKIQKSFDNAVMVSSFLAMGIWISTFLFSRDIIYFWTNDTQLYGGRNLFLVMGFYGFILSFLTSTGILFSGIKIIKIPVYLTFVEGFVNLAASLFLITKYGILGVAIGTLIGALTNFFLVNVFFNKAVNNLIKSPIYFLFKNFLFGIVFIMFILVFRLDEFNLNSKLYFFVFIIFLYSYLFYKINNVNFKDLNLFKNTIKDE